MKSKYRGVIRMRQKQIRENVQHAVRSKSKLNWTINLVSVLLGVALIYTISNNEVLFRLFVILFLVGFAYIVNKKLKELKENTAQVPKVDVQVNKSYDDTESTRIFEVDLTEKEQELKKIDLDRTQLLEELFTKAQLDEAVKQSYREKIKQKDSEQSTIMQEVINIKGRLQSAVLETKKYFVKVDPMKEVAAAIEPDKILEGSITALNDEVQTIITSLSEETVEALQKNDYIDEDFKLTRSGYKALVKTVSKES